jgi:hypothetical protein
LVHHGRLAEAVADAGLDLERRLIGLALGVEQIQR